MRWPPWRARLTPPRSPPTLKEQLREISGHGQIGREWPAAPVAENSGGNPAAFFELAFGFARSGQGTLNETNLPSPSNHPSATRIATGCFFPNYSAISKNPLQQPCREAAARGHS